MHLNVTLFESQFPVAFHRKTDLPVLTTFQRDVLDSLLAGSWFVNMLWCGQYEWATDKSQSEADLALIMTIIEAGAHQEADITAIYLQSGLAWRKRFNKDRGRITETKPKHKWHRTYLTTSIKACIRRDDANFARRFAEQQREYILANLPVVDDGPENEPDITIKDNVEWTPSTHPVPDCLIGEIARFIFSRSVNPSWKVAYAGAIAFMAAICGRQYQTATDMGLNLWLGIIGPSAIGKDEGSKGIYALRRAIHKHLNNKDVASLFFGHSTLGSAKGFLKMMEPSPHCVLSIFAEMGEFLTSLLNPNNEIMRDLKRSMTDFYMKSGMDGYYGGQRNARDVDSVSPILSPAFSILGDTTPDSFFVGLDESNVENGFLGRFTVIHVDYPDLEEDAERAATKPTDALASRCAELIEHVFKLVTDAQFITVPESDDAREFRKTYTETIAINADNDNPLSVLRKRSPLQLQKLGSLLAIGRDFKQPQVELRDYEWAADLVDASAGYILSKFAKGEVGTTSDSFKVRKAIEEVLLRFGETKWKRDFRIGKEQWESRTATRWTIQNIVRDKAFAKRIRDFTGTFFKEWKDLTTNGVLIQSSEGSELFLANADRISRK